MAVKKNTQRKGLGKGLGALFSENTETMSQKDTDILWDIDKVAAEVDSKSIVEIKLIDIEPNKGQPRKNFDKDRLMALTESIKTHGVVQPILVKPTENDTYMIIAGERRWRAAKAAKLKMMPCIIKDFDDREVMEIALIENLQREDLNPIEEAEGYRQLMEAFSLTQEEVGERVGKSRSAVANALRLNNLPNVLKKMVQDEKITQGHAR
ncbi:MAG: ParB/RepB/Spo0J family partition protein, partial [Oscillospiraceae bacterium]